MSQDENMASLSQHAEALSEARDYQGAIQIYEELLEFSIPPWQKGRLLYNIGTLQLQKGQPLQALSYFEKIDPAVLLLPRFGENLFNNLAVAYLEYAKETNSDKPISLLLKGIFTKQSLKCFDGAIELECQEAVLEGAPSCEHSISLKNWKEKAQLQLQEIGKKQRDQWIENATIESLASFLYMRMDQLLNRFEQFLDKPATSVSPYFKQIAESSLSIWNALKDKALSENQKSVIEKSLKDYSAALKSLGSKELTSAVEKWKESMKTLFILTFQDDKALQYIKLNYDLLLLKQRVTTSYLKELLDEIEELKFEESKKASLEEVKTCLKKAVESIKAQRFEEARFFILAGYAPLISLMNQKETSSASILSVAIDLSNCTLELLFLHEEVSPDEKEKKQAMLKKSQENTLAYAALFISSVLKEQNELFHQNKEGGSTCQQTPWDRVIPLFNQGKRLQSNVAKALATESVDFNQLIANQAQAINDWSEALALIKHPRESGGGSTAHLQNMKQLFQHIQEMYLEDQPKGQESVQELHSW